MISSTDIAPHIENGGAVTRVLSVLSFLMVLIASPLTITIGWLSHLGLPLVFDVWMYVSVVTLILLSILSMYRMLDEEARRSNENNLSEIKRDISSLLKHRHITLPFLFLSFASGLGYLFHFFSVYFALELIYAAVVILAMEALFHSLYRFWPERLKRNHHYQNVFIVVIIIIGFLLSILVTGTASIVMISMVFAGFALVGGIGSAFVVDLTTSNLSHFPIAGKRGIVSIVFFAFILLAVWLWYAGDFVAYISGIGVGMVGSHVIAGLKSEYQSLLSGVNTSFLSVTLALIFTAIYSASMKLRKSRISKANYPLFILMSVPIAGFLFLYLAILTDGDWVASVGGIGSTHSYALQLIPSAALFVVGYSQILIEIPRKISRTLSTQGNRFLTALTWFIVFSALAEFLSWSVYGQPGTFLFEVDVVQWFGIPIGIALLVFKYVRKK